MEKNNDWSDEMDNYQPRHLHHRGQIAPHDDEEIIVDSEWEDFEKLLR